MKSIITIFTIIVIMVSFLSCTSHTEGIGTEMNTGYLLTPEDIISIKESFDKSDEPLEIDEKTTCYWIASGAKYHIFKDCQSLSRSDPSSILEGSVSEAKKSGKESLCSFCSKRVNIKED